MSLQQVLESSLNNNYPVNMQLSIQPFQGKYRGAIKTDLTEWYRFDIDLKQDDVNMLNSELQGAIEQVSEYFREDSVDDMVGQQEMIAQLAKKGKFAFRRIFGSGTFSQEVCNALILGMTIEITSEEFIIPWELLYIGSLGSHADISCFWGMNCIISRNTTTARDFVFKLPIIPSRPRIGLVVNNKLEHVVNKEIPALQKLEEQQQIYLSRLDPMDLKQRDTELEGFASFLSEELQVVHLACHAIEQTPLSESYLLVSDNFSISMEDFIVLGFEVLHKPLVLLNACRSGTISPLHTLNWANLFRKIGARGVLATEFEVPDWFAASFIEKLYCQLLERRSIGEALLATRRYFLGSGDNPKRNPLGLGYALYSPPSICIMK